MEIQNAVQGERARYEQQQRLHELDVEKRLKFMDSLLQDKDSWVKQCEKLTQELKVVLNACLNIFECLMQTMQNDHENQIKELKERLAAEIRKQKNDWMQKENVKREKWMKEQREEILHTTAKAQFPDSS